MWRQSWSKRDGLHAGELPVCQTTRPAVHRGMIDSEENQILGGLLNVIDN